MTKYEEIILVNWSKGLTKYAMLWSLSSMMFMPLQCTAGTVMQHTYAETMLLQSSTMKHILKPCCFDVLHCSIY